MSSGEIESESEADLDRIVEMDEKQVRMVGRFGQKMEGQSKNGKERAIYMPENEVAEQKR